MITSSENNSNSQAKVEPTLPSSNNSGNPNNTPIPPPPVPTPYSNEENTYAMNPKTNTFSTPSSIPIVDSVSSISLQRGSHHEKHSSNTPINTTPPTSSSLSEMITSKQQEKIIFDLKLEISQLKKKINFLSGGSTGEQLTELLMEKEEECTKKEIEMKELEKKFGEVYKRMERLDNERQELRRTISTLKSVMGEKEASIVNLEINIETLKEEKHNFAELSVQCKSLLVDKDEEIKVLEAAYKQANQIILERDSKIQECETVIKEKEAEIEESNKTKKEIGKRARAMKAEMSDVNQSLTNEISTMKSKIALQEEEIKKKDTTIEDKDNYISTFTVRENSLSQDKGKLEVKVDMLEQEIKRLQAENLKLSKERVEAEAMKTAANHQSTVAVENMNKYKRELDSCRIQHDGELNKLQQKIIMVENRHNELQDEERRDNQNTINRLLSTIYMAQEEITSQVIPLRINKDTIEDKIKLLENDREILLENQEKMTLRTKELEGDKEMLTEMLNGNKELHKKAIAEMEKELMMVGKKDVEIVKLKRENEGLKEKIGRQEAYMKKKLLGSKVNGTGNNGTVGSSTMSNKAIPVRAKTSPSSKVLQSKASISKQSGTKVSRNLPPQRNENSNSLNRPENLQNEDGNGLFTTPKLTRTNLKTPSPFLHRPSPGYTTILSSSTVNSNKKKPTRSGGAWK